MRVIQQLLMQEKVIVIYDGPIDSGVQKFGLDQLSRLAPLDGSIYVLG